MNAFLPRLGFLLTGICAAIGAETESIEAAEKSANEWVKLRVETARLESDWRTERELVISMTKAMKERASAVEEKRDLAKAKTAKEREETIALQAKTNTAKDDVKFVDERLQALTQKLLVLRRSMPPRLSEALDLSYRSLAATELPAGERMQLVMTVLNRCAQFNRVITVGEEVLAFDGESAPKARQTIYWGLSHGYALDPASQNAWLGSPGSDGWKWELQAGAYASVVQLLAIANDRADPGFVVVPAAVARFIDPTAKK